MRKEVIYSLAALSLAPVAANAGVNGEVIPGIVTGNNWENDIDGKADNGEVKWVSGSVKFTISQKLVPGDYTFTAQLHNPGIGVVFEIPSLNIKETKAAQDAEADVTESQDVAVKFTITEEVTGLEIVVHGVTDFQEGSMQNFLLSFAKDGDNLTQGIEFNQSNFKNDNGTWKQPLAGINQAIDLYVNQTLNYESDEAKKVMTAEKEKIQKATTDDKLTYAFYMENQIYDPTVETNPLYKEATSIFNEATRIEAEYQADEIKKMVDEFIADPDNGYTEYEVDEETGELVPVLGADGKPVVSEAAKAMAKKVYDEIDAYKAVADAKTGSTADADGKFQPGKDTPVEILNKTLAEGGFDVDPTVSPLKEILEDVESLVEGGEAGQLVDAMEAVYDAVQDIDAQLEDRFGATDDNDPEDGVPTMANTHATDAADYLSEAKKITAYYKGLVDGILSQVTAKDIADLDEDNFDEKIKTQLNNIKGQLKSNVSPLSLFFTVYNNYTAKLEAAIGNVPEKNELTKSALYRYGVLDSFKEKSAAFDAQLTKAGNSFNIPALETPKDAQGKVVGVVVKDADGKDVKKTNLKQPKSTSMTDKENADAVDVALLEAFNKYVDALNEMAKLYDRADGAQKAIDAAYKANPNADKYDNRNYFKQSFINYYYSTKTSEGKQIKDKDVTEVSNPQPETLAQGQTADATQYDFWSFLQKLEGQLNAEWRMASNGTYAGLITTYVSDNYLLKTLGLMSGMLPSLETLEEEAPVFEDHYTKFGIELAAGYAEFSTKFEAYKGAVDKLRNKVASLPIYNANPELYADIQLKTVPTLQNPSSQSFNYTIPEEDGAKMTYKQIIAAYDQLTKDVNKALKDAKKVTDDSQNDDHYQAMQYVFELLDGITINDGEVIFNDNILDNVDEFVKKNGFIDQQSEAYSDVMPQDNFQQLMAHLGGSDFDQNVEGDGAIKTLAKRLKMDQSGNEGVKGWREAASEDEFEAGDYIVGIDQNGDGEKAWDEGVCFADLKDFIDTYDHAEKKLNEDNVKYIEELFTAYGNKYSEAKALYDQYYYTEEEANAHNATLEGAVQEGDVMKDVDGDDVLWTEADAKAHNQELEGAKFEGDNTGEFYNTELANAYNANLDGAVSVGQTLQAHPDYPFDTAPTLSQFYSRVGHYPENVLDQYGQPYTGDEDQERSSAVLTANDVYEYNSRLTGAVKDGDPMKYSDASATAYNETLEGAVKPGDPKKYTKEEADAYNANPANVPGRVVAKDFKPVNDNWTKEDYEKANGDLGEAIAIINEVNDKLLNELEPELMAEYEAQLQHFRVVNALIPTVDPSGREYDPTKVKYQAAFAQYPEIDNVQYWWNGRKGVSSKLLKPYGMLPFMWTSILAEYELVNGGQNAEQFADRINDIKEVMNANDKDIYEEFKGIYNDIMALYASIDQSYRNRDFSAWNLKLEEGDQQVAEEWTINNTTLNNIEKRIKKFVDKCINEQIKMQDNYEALFKLMTLSNYDDDVNENFDFVDLFNYDDVDSRIEGRLAGQLRDYVNIFSTHISTASFSSEQEEYLFRMAILYSVSNAKFDLRNLLQTTGIQALLANDAEAKTREDLLEPFIVTKDPVTGEDVVTNLHTFYNQLAAPGLELDPEVFEENNDAAAARALKDQVAATKTTNSTNELYNALKAFVEDLNTMKANRTLGDNFVEMKKRLDDLSQNIILIDEHAKANNEAYDDMLVDVSDYQGEVDDLQDAIDAMPDGTAKDNCQAALDNFQKNYVDGLKAVADHNYKQGWAWQDGSTTDVDTQQDWQDALDETAEELAKVTARITGEDNTAMVEDNIAAYEKFVNLYEDANEEHTDLVAKLEQLKNLNANVAAEGDNFKKSAEDLAAAINTFLFGKVGDNPDATETAQDKLDKAYKEGTAAKEEANKKPVSAWAEKTYTDRIKAVKDQIESYLTQVDNKILEAIEMWNSKNGDIYAAAEYAFKNYNIYKPAYLKVDAMPGHKKEEPTEAEVKAYQEAYKAAVEKIITDNGDFSELWNRTNAIDDAIESFTSKDNNKTVGSKTYKRGNFNSLNKLFDQIAWFDLDNADGNYATTLADGKNAEAAADAAMYKEFADAHLAEDAAAIISLGLALDDEIPYANETFEKILKDYDKVVTVQEGVNKGKDVVVTTANHDEYINKIQAIAGSWKGYTTSGNNLSWDWNENGRCAFAHKLIQNNNVENQEANLAALDELQNKLNAAKAYIKGYQVAAEYASDIQALQDAIDRYKEFAQDEKVIMSAFSISKKVQDLVKEFGNITTIDTKKIEDYAGADKEFGTADDVFGGMGAEVGKIPAALVNAAWDAEKKALKQDINEMRAAVKLLDQDDAHYTDEDIKAYSDAVEALWKKVDAAKREVKKIETKVKDKPSKWDFEAQVRDDLSKLQPEVLALYKELRGLTRASQNISGIAANGNSRLAALRANVVEDEYAAGAPNVKKLQAELNALIADAQELLSAAVADGSADFFRQKIETMLQNAENKLTERDEAAQVWTDRYEYYSKYLTEAAKAVDKSKEAVNKWVDSEKYPTSEAYDLAATQSALYAVAQEKLDDAIELSWAIVDEYKYANGQYVLTEELEDAIEAYMEAIAEAEDACADYDLMNRVKAINKTLDELKNKAANGVYEEGYLEDNQICSKDEDGEITWGWKVNYLESRISKLISLIESETKLTTTDLDGTSSDYAYENLRARIEQWILDDPDTEKDETELVHGIQFRLEELADIIGNNVLGDMNKDGKVTLADVRIIANIALGIEEMPNVGSDEFMRADVNEDGIIDITDASCAVNIYFYGNPEGINYWIPEEARSAENVKEAVNVTATKTAQGLTRLAINLDNAQQFTAFQMDLQLAEGMKLAAASLGERAGKQFLLTNEADGMLHIGAMSITNGAISGNSGAVLYLDFEVAEGAEENFARFQNVFFVTKNAKKVNFELGGITPTGIQSANAETALGQKFYDLGGRMKSSLKKGVNIVKDAAGNVKKVIVK